MSPPRRGRICQRSAGSTAVAWNGSIKYARAFREVTKVKISVFSYRAASLALAIAETCQHRGLSGCTTGGVDGYQLLMMQIVGWVCWPLVIPSFRYSTGGSGVVLSGRLSLSVRWGSCFTVFGDGVIEVDFPP